jgi:hypothetical protein
LGLGNWCRATIIRYPGYTTNSKDRFDASSSADHVVASIQPNDNMDTTIGSHPIMLKVNGEGSQVARDPGRTLTTC